MVELQGNRPAGARRQRRRLLDDAFAEAAREVFAVPDQDAGRRRGLLPAVRPDGRAVLEGGLRAEAVPDERRGPTQFGVHLILVTDRKPGLDVKYEEIKDDVKDEFCDRLRDEVVAKVKPHAKIEITPAPK